MVPRLIKKIPFFAKILLLITLSASAQADIKVHDYGTPFIKGYNELKIKNKKITKNYILKYESLHQSQLSEIFYEGYKVTDDKDFLIQLDNYSSRLPVLINKYDKKIPEIKEIIAEVDKKFQNIFGVKLNTNVYLFTALSESDAITTASPPVKGPIVAINLKTVAGYSKDDLRILFAHEFFHVLQHQMPTNLPNAGLIDENLFVEGWATYASSLIYPGKPSWKYISYFEKDSKQYQKFESDKKLIIDSLLKDWNTKDEEKVNKYFIADSNISIPFEPRSGYYIGFIVAKKMAEQKSDKTVALLKYTEFKKLIKPVLKKMLVA